VQSSCYFLYWALLIQLHLSTELMHLRYLVNLWFLLSNLHILLYLSLHHPFERALSSLDVGLQLRYLCTVLGYGSLQLLNKYLSFLDLLSKDIFIRTELFELKFELVDNSLHLLYFSLSIHYPLYFDFVHFLLVVELELKLLNLDVALLYFQQQVSFLPVQH
jgi:hypothetical protein